MKTFEINNNVDTPLMMNESVRKAQDELRKVRTQWYQVRDHLTLEENARALDTINATRDWIYRQMLINKQFEELIQAQYN